MSYFDWNYEYDGNKSNIIVQVERSLSVRQLSNLILSFGNDTKAAMEYFNNVEILLLDKIYKLLFSEVIKRVPERTGYLKSIIETQSKIDYNKGLIRIGSNGKVDYAPFVEHLYNNETLDWPAKKKSYKQTSTLPFLRPSLYKNILKIDNMVRRAS